MSDTKGVMCRYCGMHAYMRVLKVRRLPGDKPVLAYEVRCPRCDKRQWTHDKGEKKCVR